VLIDLRLNPVSVMPGVAGLAGAINFFLEIVFFIFLEPLYQGRRSEGKGGGLKKKGEGGGKKRRETKKKEKGVG